MSKLNGKDSEISVFRNEHIQNLIVDHVGHVNDLGIAVLDKDRRHIFANTQYAMLLNIPHDSLTPNITIEDVIKQSIGHDTLSDEFKTTVDQELRHMSDRLSGGVTSDVSRSIRTIDGRRLSMRGHYTKDHFLIMTLKDVTESKRNKALLDVAMSEGKSGYWAYHFGSDKFTYSDSVKDRLSAREIKRIEETGLWAIITQEDLPGMMAAWQQTLEHGTPINVTYRVKTEKDGVIWQHSKGKIYFADDGRASHIVAYVRDITQDVDTQQALVVARKASHMKTEFLARMSHEIKTPLNAIIGLADGLLLDNSLNDKARQAAGYIDKAAEGLNTLLTQILDHSKLSSQNVKLENRDADIRDLLDEKVAIWRPACEKKGLTLSLIIDESVPQIVHLDTCRLEQCLNNVLSNAVKFTDTGKIRVIAKCVTLKDTQTLAIAIKDTGIGLSQEQAEKVFTPFEQADTSTTRLYGGTGLGMSITQRTLKLMGGEIHYQSRPGKGTVFLMTLPLNQPQKKIEAKTAAPPDKDVNLSVRVQSHPVMPFANLNVLCVEDNKANHLVVERLIGDHVKSLTFAVNGVEALKRLEVQAYDIVLMDIHMPEMNGIETTIEIRNSSESWANIIIIALTADPDYQHARICKNLGMDGSVSKPVRRKDLFTAFDHALKQRLKPHSREHTARKAG